MAYNYDDLRGLRRLFGDMSGAKENCPFWKNGSLDEKYSCNEKYKDPLELMAAYEKLYGQVRRLQSFAKNQSLIYLFDAADSAVEEVKNEYHIPEGTHCEWELFYACLAAEAVCGALDKERRYVFIDEFQDFSPVELRCISNVFPSAVLNLFGDLKQCISPKGIEQLEQIPFQMQQYVLRENYRNALEITEYVNQTFAMDMLPIGIHGKVQTASEIPALPATGVNGDRIALIYKSQDDLKWLGVSQEDTDYAFQTDENQHIVSEKINVFQIYQAKGLEFERVFVVTGSMTQNELYVAVTRALNELVIITPT